MDEEDDDLFDWLTETYSQPQTDSDYKNYEVVVGTIEKKPTGEEKLIGFQVRRRSNEQHPE